MSGMFRSVTGDLLAEKMGNTYTHEHIYCDPSKVSNDETLAITNIDRSIEELRLFRSVGGGTVIEGTTEDYGRNPLMLKKAAVDSGINIVATTGFYLFEYHPPWTYNATDERIAEHFEVEITEGIDNTKIPAGQIKCAVSNKFIHPYEEKMIRAAVIAQKKTGAPIWIHHGGMLGVEVLQIIEKNGGDMSNVILGHMDRNPDPYEYRKIASMGSMMSIDNIARVHRYPIQTNVNMLKDLMDMGCEDRILISADFGRTTYLESYGGGPGFRFLLTRFVARLKDELHLSQSEIDVLFQENPRKVYAAF